MTEIMEKNGNLSFGIVSETTRPYVDQRGPEDVLLSFRYVLPWFGDRAVLDVGCSTGSYLALCPPGSHGVDVSRPNLRACEERGLRATAVDLNGDLPFENRTIPAILCSHVLEHVDAPIQVLRTCNRILAEDGIFALGLPIETSVVNWIRGENYFRDHPGHFYSFSLQNISTLLTEAGFRIRGFYFEPRIVRTVWWLQMLQRLPRTIAYPLSIGYWVIADKGNV